MLTLLLGSLTATPGCYYGHLASGQTRILLASSAIDKVLADPNTSDTLRKQLELVEAVRVFAERLGLDVGQQYTSYVAWPGDRIVTTVVATEPGKITPRNFRFPIVGNVPYKGFFAPERAEAEAETLRAQGLDVCLLPVSAYSTLGWLNDPVTTPMLRRGDAALAETLLHELLHATVFVADQPDFNEGAANFFGEEASLRFLAERDPAALPLHRSRIHDSRLLDAALNELRDDIAVLYKSPSAASESQREELDRQARERIAGLPFKRRDGSQLAEKLRLNDACLAIQGTYAGDVMRHAQVLDELGGDLRAYLRRLQSVSKSPEPKTGFFVD